MLRSHKNQLFQIVASAGLSPRLFEWTTSELPVRSPFGSSADRLIHHPTSCHFDFAVEGKEYLLAHVIPTRTGNRRQVSRPTSWSGVLKAFERWVKVIASETVEPDLWEESNREAVLAPSIGEHTDNSPFTEAERVRINDSITDLRGFILNTQELSSAQLRIVDERLKHMQDAASRLGRKDWLSLTLGSLSGIAVGAALAPEQAKMLVAQAATLFEWVAVTLAILPQ